MRCYPYVTGSERVCQPRASKLREVGEHLFRPHHGRSCAVRHPRPSVCSSERWDARLQSGVQWLFDVQPEVLRDHPHYVVVLPRHVLPPLRFPLVGQVRLVVTLLDVLYTRILEWAVESAEALVQSVG